MGLDASVKCQCWERGLCNVPPSLSSILVYDPTTAEVHEKKHEALSPDQSLALNLEFDLWIEEGACIHQSMCIARERILNWGGLREFQHALRSLGEGLYGNLLRELPNENGGSTKPADARVCLDELDQFCATMPFGAIVQLVDLSDGNVIHSRGAPYAGWLGTDGATGISLRLMEDGTSQIKRGESGLMGRGSGAEILFISRKFKQMRISSGGFCLTD